MIYYRAIKILFVMVLATNIVYFTRTYHLRETELKQAELNHISTISYDTDDQVQFSPNKPYAELDQLEKVAYLLKSVDSDKERFWLAQTEITEPNLQINPQDFLPGANDESPNWSNKPTLFYDPRFTLSVYINEIKHQLLTKNPHNEKAKDNMITVPFAWSDWVDLTMLNEELAKPVDERADCGWLQEKVNKPTKYPDFCVNLRDLPDEELAEIGLPSKEYLPGFVVKGSPMNKAPHKQVMMQGKAHLLTHQENPLSIIFLTKDGTYEAQVAYKQRIVHSSMFSEFLSRKNIDVTGDSMVDEVILNPITEFRDLNREVKSRPLNWDDDIYKMNSITRQKSANASRELYLDPKAFDYKVEQVEEQIIEYETRLDHLKDALTNELHYDLAYIQKIKLDRHEMNHYKSLKHAYSVPLKDETTYYKLATLLKVDGNKDAGWHYEWRFFNGGLRYLKDGWTQTQLEIREQIILDRLLRNWFRFAEEKGIISWIAHGPLLSWYWDGLMFPYDIDIDIQMPSAELNRLSKHYNMTLVIEDVNDGFGKYLIDCATFLQHRDMAPKDNHIDARFIDVDTGTYIDITGLGKNEESPPQEFNSYIRNKNAKGDSVNLYSDRRKHWLTFESISPLRYSMIGGVPVYVPNDIMSMLNHEYPKGTTSYQFEDYFYVPILRLWLKRDRLQVLLDDKGLKDINLDQMTEFLKGLTVDDKVKLLETHDSVLIEYYLTHKHTQLHEIEKKFMLDPTLQYSILDLKDNYDYHQLTSNFKMGSPLRKSLYDYEYIERLKHQE
ncbi:hypothetical protein PSN45_005003 [Yamadazyma tenuis]|uniref:LicD/FKTN/FKRP nucleotidyltransferase domain-containing protein n=1 Tax=Candida tenuis (strain ATCC 10573 / BCRC 21748 / CBS 615 / JCM 9827 / NBRC 10315 / NRRL Y-1498 / VKM Y-70) TaxID=590646 RepID=G3B2G0_CANTC|nr:uncharacterized protein CANTEDRAFT_104045 [Yamadazyma tenuis ATCC 10573]EGV64664.1 hypothetical protein CANTEDRAFT_104045 [Yamadazyma tenuis ATCC 10573]WEJ97452.1 hypothetical protein PSN45_005003 [Yamadazyma tenuis]